MGQLLLGFRSLIIKVAIFVVLAALLAWALGGTLWPRPHIVDHAAMTLDGGAACWWQLRVGGSAEKDPRWHLVLQPPNGQPHRFADSDDDAAEPKRFADVAGPVRVGGDIAFAGLTSPGSANQAWSLYIMSVPSFEYERATLPDRLAVEQQLARLQAGLPLQSAEIITRQRATVIDPPANADEDQVEAPDHEK